MKEKKKQGGIKDAFRKFIVALKRRPSMIPLVAFIVAFLVYSLNLTQISNTTAKIQGANMGLCGFVTMLFSMLSIVCFLNAFPNRKPVVKPMLILHLLMDAALIGCDIYYRNTIFAAVTRAENPIVVNETTMYIAYAHYYLQVHIIVIVIAVVLLALLPVYSKLLRKINTNVEVEDNGAMDAIDLSE
ncbi:MAG: hypothetical protein ACSW8F_00100 [bacterium]